LKLITWNVNGIRAREAELLALLEEEKPDVACFQETKATLEQLPASLYGLMAVPGYHAIWHGSAGYSGVGLLLKKSTFERPKSAHPLFDYETRVAEAHVGDFVFVTMYLPNGGKDFDAKIRFMKALAEYPAAFAGKTLIIAGDLNVAHTDMDVHKSQRKMGLIGQRTDERALFDKLLAGGLVDVCRKLAPNDKEFFTWWPYWRGLREKNVGWRIDYVLASEPYASRATEFRSRRDYGTSDHAPLIVSFADA